MLEGHGIRAMVDADGYAGLPLPMSAGVELRVLEEDAQRARCIVETSDKNRC